jgi:hypothetical protein
MGTAALVTLLVASGCESMGDGAKKEFSRSYSCPESSTESRERKDLTPYDVRHWDPTKPPPDVAADPTRLAVWEKNEQETRQSVNSHYTVMEVRGCSRTALYECGRVNTGSASGSISCSESQYPAGVAKW